MLCVASFVVNFNFVTYPGQDEGEMPSPLLNLAAESGYAEVVKVLLDEASVPVDSLGEFGTSPLFDACYFDNR